jgi:error-prone DNA polymerase
LPPLTLQQEVELDVATQSMSVRPHPLTFLRAQLTAGGVLPLARLHTVATGRKVLIAGKLINAQRPPTAKGMAFLVLEDETSRVQVALPPKVADTLYRALAVSHILLVAGPLERTGQQQQGQQVSVLAHGLRAVPPDVWYGTATSAESDAEQGKRASTRPV